MATTPKQLTRDLLKPFLELKKEEDSWAPVATFLQNEFKVSKEELDVLEPYVTSRSRTVIEENDKKTTVYGPLRTDPQSFDKIIKHLGPIVPNDFEDPNDKYWTLGKVSRLYSQEWFHAFLNAEGAGYRLGNLPDNSWLIRFSSRELGGFAISIAVTPTKVENYSVSPSKKNPNNGKEIFVAGWADKKFPDIYALAEHFKVEKLPDSNAVLGKVCPCLEGKVKIGIKLGGGNFGEVFKGVWKRPTGDIGVAAKILTENKEGATQKDQTYDASQAPTTLFSKEFEAEANLLKSLDHDNVIRFFGICLVYGQQFILTELMDLGSVKDFLMKKAEKSQITPVQILNMAKDTARGMAYLQSKGILHRDLAARNLLLKKTDSGDFMVKVTDFGLGRKVGVDGKYQRTFTAGHTDPVRWAAPETNKFPNDPHIFQGVVTLYSDRWSFGIILFELFTFCKIDPYFPMDNGKVKSMLAKLEDVSLQLTLEDAPDGVFEVMKKCLQYKQEERPDFLALERELGEIEKKLLDNSDLNKWKDNGDQEIGEVGEGTYDDKPAPAETYDQNQDVNEDD